MQREPDEAAPAGQRVGPFATAQCQSDPDRPADLDAGCAQPLPFVSAGQQPFAHALLGTPGAEEMSTATLSASVNGRPLTVREIVVWYADAKVVAVEFDGDGWADTDYTRVLNLALTAAR